MVCAYKSENSCRHDKSNIEKRKKSGFQRLDIRIPQLWPSEIDIWAQIDNRYMVVRNSILLARMHRVIYSVFNHSRRAANDRNSKKKTKNWHMIIAQKFLHAYKINNFF